MNHKINFCFFICLLIACISGIAKATTDKTIFITKDSLYYSFNELWKFCPQDDASMRSKDFDDSNWKSVLSTLPFDEVSSKGFKGFGWFRVHFRADSSITGRPLALSVKQSGASEIYLDGILIKTYGEIKDSLHYRYYDPQDLPCVIMLHDTGEHVFAIRYANYQVVKNTKFSRQADAGFTIILGETESLITINNYRSIVLSVILMALTGIFFVLSLLHLFLYLFYPVSKSNLFFSLFMFCLATGCMIGFISFFSSNPSLQTNSKYLNNFLFCFGCLALSGFLNRLFSKKNRIRRWIVISMAVVSMMLRIFNSSYYPFVTVMLIISVSFEAIAIITIALVRKVKGARIIGTGILFLTLFLLTIFTLAIISGGRFDVNDTTTSGKIISLIAVIAILSVPFSMSVYLAWNFGSINKELGQQLDQVKLLSQKNLEQEQEKVRLITGQNAMLEEKVEERTQQLQIEKKKSDDLLLNILPEEVADELKNTGRSEAKLYSDVSVLFTDFANFTGISENLSPKVLVNEIDICFKAFDEIMEHNGLEKIKTIGDAYLAVSGLPNSNASHAENTIRAALEILDFMKRRKNDGGLFEIRIGINSGPVVAGIVGIKKFAYDIWGDTVNTAARMEQKSEKGKINISGVTYSLIKDKFECTYRGKIEAKNKGEIDMYFVV